MTPPAPADDRLERLVRSPNSASRGGRGYSSFVRSLRLVLPLSAGALLLLAIIWPQLDWQHNLDVSGLPSSIDEVESQEIRMVAARLVGTDEEGRPFTLLAKEAHQLDGVLNRVFLLYPQGEVELEDGISMNFTADEGEYSRTTEQVVFRGHVVVNHGLGYMLKTEVATVDIPKARAFGDKPVSGIGPSGKLTGSGFEILDKGKTVKILGRSKITFSETPQK